MPELTENQKKILETKEHLLVTGGPGSGKTYVSILKATKMSENDLDEEQEILFLSFARATISRIWEALEKYPDIDRKIKERIEVDTYHSFFWRIIKTHGYLLGLPRKLTVLPPPAEAVALFSIRSEYKAEKNLTEDKKQKKIDREKKELERLAKEEGKVCFDLFSCYAYRILCFRNKIRLLISDAFPYVILDEFQDTNAEQWNVIRAIGIDSKLLAFADPEQRIFDFIGADPERLNHFRKEFSPQEYDLSNANHRSPGTDISVFGNDILNGSLRQRSYSGVYCKTFPSCKDIACRMLKTETFEAIKRITENKKNDWSLAVLVPTKKLMREVSVFFRNEQPSLPAIPHQAFIDMHGAILAAEVIAFLLQPASSEDENLFVDLLCKFFHGKSGDSPTQEDIKTSTNIKKAHEKILECRRNGEAIRLDNIANKILKVYGEAREISLSGDAYEDWISIRGVLEEGKCERLKKVASEARNIRLLDRGTQLREALSQKWRDSGSYIEALEAVRQAFIQEHFATSVKPETGVIVMNMHKAKGKQFDEVIIFERWPIGNKEYSPDRIVRKNLNLREDDLMQCKQNLRVSVTRAKTRTTIMTPSGDPCIILFPWVNSNTNR